MSTLDGDWEKVKLADVAESINAGGTPRRNVKKYWDNGEIPWLKISDLKSVYISESEERITKKGLENSSAKLFPRGTVLFSIFATIGASGILEKPSTTNQAIAGIVPDKRRIDTKFLYYLLKSEKNKITNKKTHATQDNINLTVLRNHEFLLPPLETQHKIVSILEKAEQLKLWRKKADKLTDDYLSSVFLEMFGNPVSNDKNWEVKSLQKISNVSRGKSRHRPRNASFLFGGKYPFIQTGDISNSDGRILTHSQTLSEEGIKQSKLFPKGTIVMSIAANIGYTAILDFDCYFPDSIVGIIPNETYVLPTYLHYCLKFYRNKLDKEATSTAQKNINLGILNPLRIPLPPIGFQRNFAKIVEYIEHIKKLQKKSKEQIDVLLNSLTQKSFKGELLC